MKPGDIARIIRVPDQPAWLHMYEDRVCLITSEMAWDGINVSFLREILIDGKTFTVHVRDLEPLEP